jgi:hypothetical protein
MHRAGRRDILTRDWNIVTPAPVFMMNDPGFKIGFLGFCLATSTIFRDRRTVADNQRGHGH